MSIICATHFSSSSFSAVRVAAALSRRHQEPLFLLNVQEDFSLLTPDTGDHRTDARNALRLEAAALASDGVAVETAVERGPLAPTVWNYARSRRASLLVVGDTHHLTSALFETPLDKLAHGGAIPMLVVRDEKPLLAWAEGTRPLKVLLSLDRTWTSATARNWVKRFAEYGPIELTVCHLWTPADEYERRRLPPQAEHHQLATMIRGEVEAELMNLPDNVTHTVHLDIVQGSLADQLIALATEKQVDLFVIGTHPDHGPLARRWSVTHDVLGLAPMSVTCVPGVIGPEPKKLHLRPVDPRPSTPPPPPAPSVPGH